MIRKAKLLLLTIIIAGLAPSIVSAREIVLAASIYVGWMPWYYAHESGLLENKFAAKGLSVRFAPGDYLETVTQLASGKVDAVAVTNMDALTLIASAGTPVDVVLIGSYSNGNDAILMHPKRGPDLRGRRLGLVELSVSHYLLDRYLRSNQMTLSDVEVVNIADPEIAGAYAAGSSLDGVVTWNPIVLQIMDMGATKVTDSAKFPKEIADLLVVRRDVLEREPAVAEALLATWFEVMDRMKGPEKGRVIDRMGALSGSRGNEYVRQLETTWIADSIERGLAALEDADMRRVMTHVVDFADRMGMLAKAPPPPYVSYGDEPKKLVHFAPSWLRHYAASR